jgi:hypothetical protein
VIAPAGWDAQYFAAAAEHPALWSLAPKADITLAPGDSVNFTLQNISCSPRTQSGNFQIYYYALPVIPDSVAPLSLPVMVQVPESNKNAG